MSRELDLSLYLVADVDVCGERGLVETVRAAVAGGVTTVQLRDHGATTHELLDAALALRDLLATSGVGLVVNDRLDVAMAAGADGVHLGQSDLPVEAAREIAGPEFVIGWSVTNFAEAKIAADLPPGTVDYLGVGPIYSTQTKLDAAAPMGVEGLRAVCAISSVPCVAIGGITADRVAELVGVGAVGIAVVAAICSAADPRAAAAELRNQCGR
ncbi:MAG: thiamine phosphate synthase [Acidimicrobiales bacterium]